MADVFTGSPLRKCVWIVRPSPVVTKMWSCKVTYMSCKVTHLSCIKCWRQSVDHDSHIGSQSWSQERHMIDRPSWSQCLNAAVKYPWHNYSSYIFGVRNNLNSILSDNNSAVKSLSMSTRHVMICTERSQLQLMYTQFTGNNAIPKYEVGSTLAWSRVAEVPVYVIRHSSFAP